MNAHSHQHALSLDDADTFFFMRGFPDLGSREPLRPSFTKATCGKHELESVLMPMIEKYNVVLVDDPENLIHW
jgi:hypothetical protein